MCVRARACWYASANWREGVEGATPGISCHVCLLLSLISHPQALAASETVQSLWSVKPRDVP